MANTGNCVKERIMSTLLGMKYGMITYSLELRSISTHTRRVRVGLFRSSDRLCSGMNSPSIYLRVT